MLSVGTDAPSFSLAGAEDGDIGTFSLNDYDGEVVVLVFYIGDFNATCTDELCTFRDVDLLSVGDQVQVLGISTDTAFSRRAFAERNALDFPLLSDNDGSVAEAYDVLYDRFAGRCRIAKRSVYVIDHEGVIRYAWVADQPDEMPDVDALRGAIEAVADDDTALDRYRDGYADYHRGDERFRQGMSVYESGDDWLTAGAAMDHAAEDFGDATDAFETARRFADAAAIDDAAAVAAERSRGMAQVAKWFGEAAEAYGIGDAREAGDWHDDATDRYAAVSELAEPTAPDTLESDGAS